MGKLRIGVLISGSGSNLQAIIDACAAGKINGEVVFVGSDRPDVYGLERAEKHNIPTFVVDYAKLASQFEGGEENVWPADCDWVEVFRKMDSNLNYGFEIVEKLRIRVLREERLLREIGRFGFHLLVLAGFMRLLTPYFIDRINSSSWDQRIMNIHPALLPSFPGTDGYGDTWRYGCKIAGSTVHFIDYGEDTGPIIGQRAFAIQEGETIEDIKKRGLEQEWELFPECIQLYAEGRLRIVERDIGEGKVKKIVWIAPPNQAQA